MAVVKRFYKKNGAKKIRYQAQVYVKGKRVDYRTFDSKREAVQWHQEKRQFLKGGPLIREKNSYLLSDCVEGFQNRAVPFLQKPTRQSYLNGLKYLLESPLRNVEMNHLNSRHIHHWIDWLKKHPTVYTNSRKSFHFELKLLTTILNWYKHFVDESFNNPVTKQHKQSCYYKIIRPRCPDYFMRPMDAKNWLNWIKRNRENPVYWRIAVFMLLTGARICEVCAMKWDAINLEEGTARVMRIIRWDFHTRKPELVETTKTTNSARLLVLPDDLVKILRQMKAEDSENCLLFKKDTGKPLNYVTVQRVFNKGFEALSLPWRSTHILRHSYATMALLATKDLVSVQASLGHKSSRMTERYAKAVALLTKDTAQKTSQVFGVLGKKSVPNYNVLNL
ncbi:MAG: site-specific integrase [Bdellovibrionales bacterium]|nr:site-specific integrase [Bdellovibrionales bacterium]